MNRTTKKTDDDEEEDEEDEERSSEPHSDGYNTYQAEVSGRAASR